MGMDVSGIGNKDAYFRANIWSWPVIHSIIIEANETGKLGISEITLEMMKSNGGAGLTTPQECLALADEIEKNLEKYPGEEIHGDFQSKSHDAVLNFIKNSLNLKVENSTAYKSTKKHLREFIAFLRECEGFEVY